MAVDYRERFGEITPTVFHGPWGKRFRGAIGTLLDSTVQASIESLNRMWLRRGLPVPDDGLVALGNQRNLGRYPVETKAQYRARVDRAWLDWIYSGGPKAMVDQLAAAGWPGAQILYRYSPELPVTPPADYWSQFWVYFPYGVHNVTGVSPKWGEFVWGDGTVYGPIGITRPEILLLRGIVRKWKPGNWICRKILFGLQPEVHVESQSNFGYSITGGTVQTTVAGVQADDVLIAQIEWFGDSGNLSVPSGEGWTLIVGGGTSDEHCTAIYWKRWGSGSTDNLTSTWTMGGIQNAVKVLVVRDAVDTGTPITNASNQAVSAATKMVAPNVTVDNPRSLVLRMFSSLDNNNHGNPSEGSLLYGGLSHQAINTISCSHRPAVASATTGTATMDQLANGPDAARVTTLVVEGANTSVTYAQLSP